jgi:hypothetical protein
MSEQRRFPPPWSLGPRQEDGPLKETRRSEAEVAGSEKEVGDYEEQGSYRQ